MPPKASLIVARSTTLDDLVDDDGRCGDGHGNADGVGGDNGGPRCDGRRRQRRSVQVRLQYPLLTSHTRARMTVGGLSMSVVAADGGDSVAHAGVRVMGPTTTYMCQHLDGVSTDSSFPGATCQPGSCRLAVSTTACGHHSHTRAKRRGRRVGSVDRPGAGVYLLHELLFIVHEIVVVERSKVPRPRSAGFSTKCSTPLFYTRHRISTPVSCIDTVRRVRSSLQRGRVIWADGAGAGCEREEMVPPVQDCPQHPTCVPTEQGDGAGR